VTFGSGEGGAESTEGDLPDVAVDEREGGVAMIAEHSASGARRAILGPLHWLWCFLFQFIYFACKGMWGIAVVSFFTLNGLFLILPIMNRSLVRKHYENMGWRVIER